MFACVMGLRIARMHDPGQLQREQTIDENHQDIFNEG